MLFVCTDWLVWKLIARTIHLWTADETESHLKSLISNPFLVYWKKQTNIFVFVWYMVTQLLLSVLLQVVNI